MSIIGLKELRENTNQIIKRIDKGETILVVKKSKPIFKLSPVKGESEIWETVADFTEIAPEGVPAERVLAALKKMNAKN